MNRECKMNCVIGCFERDFGIIFNPRNRYGKIYVLFQISFIQK